MLIPPADAEHFLRVYKEVLHHIAGLEDLDMQDYGAARNKLFEKHLQAPPTGDEDLLAALKTASYGTFIVGRHLARCTEMIGPDEQVFRVQGITTELGDMMPPWIYVKTAVMQFKEHWICDGLIVNSNILIGRNMIRDLSDLIRRSKPTAPPKKRKPRAKRGKTSKGTMSKAKEDKVREERIIMEIVVDAYDESERAIGWYCYLENQLKFPFSARCLDVRGTSPLEEGEEVEVVAMAPSEDCEHEMFVAIKWKKRKLEVPLSQLEAVDADDETREAVEDWHYWTNRGYEF